MNALSHGHRTTSTHLLVPGNSRDLTFGLVLTLGVCLGFLGGVGYALLAIGVGR